MDATRAAAPPRDRALAWVETLSEEIGGRRPASRSERLAFTWLRDELAAAGVDASLEQAPAYSTFALPQAAVLALALGSGALPRRRRVVRAALGLAAAGLGALEDDLRHRPLSRALARGRTHNLIATLEPREEPRRTLCLVSHIDSSRSGWLFSAAVAPHLRALLGLTSAAIAAQAAAPVLEGFAAGRAALDGSRLVSVAGLLLLAERELRGVDVPGANDNASGVAVSAALAAELARDPLRSTRVVLLVCGAEEAGLLGAEAFIRSRPTGEWLFLNFDGVGAPAPLRYLPAEGLLRARPADRGLLKIARRLGERRPELGLEPIRRAGGLTYDSTVVLARGGRALTISAQADDGAIPNYHRPGDDISNIDPGTLGRALEIGRELVEAIDRGEADDSTGSARRRAA